MPLWYSIAYRIDLHDCHAISARTKDPEESATIFPPVQGLAQIHTFAISDEFVDAHLPVRKCFRLLRAIVIPATAKKKLTSHLARNVKLVHRYIKLWPLNQYPLPLRIY